MSDESITFGRIYRDVVSGWQGVATAEYRYMNGCIRVELSGKDKDGKPDSFVFDIEQIALLVHEEPVLVVDAQPTGGPRDNRPVPR